MPLYFVSKLTLRNYFFRGGGGGGGQLGTCAMWWSTINYIQAGIEIGVN